MIHIMFKSLKLPITALLVVAYLFLSVTISSPVHAAESAKEAACKGLGVALDSNEDCTDDEGSGLDETIASFINILSILVGAISVFMIILGGLKYITSAGDSNSISSAKNTILYAIVGLIIVGLAQILVIFVIEKTNPAPAQSTPTSNVDADTPF